MCHPYIKCSSECVSLQGIRTILQVSPSCGPLFGSTSFIVALHLPPVASVMNMPIYGNERSAHSCCCCSAPAGCNVFNVSVDWTKSRSDGLKQVCMSMWVCQRWQVTHSLVTCIRKNVSKCLFSFFLSYRMIIYFLSAGGHSVDRLPKQILQREQEEWCAGLWFRCDRVSHQRVQRHTPLVRQRLPG